MTDREWPEYPNQSGGETVTGPESAQEEAASERGWEADPPSPASEECQSEEGSNWERTAQEAQEEVPGGQRGEDLGTPGQAQELQEHRAGSPEWNPQRIAERNRICPPNLRNRPARSSKRLRLSLRRKPRCRFKRKTHGSLEPSARRILTAGKAGAGGRAAVCPTV